MAISASASPALDDDTPASTTPPTSATPAPTPPAQSTLRLGPLGSTQVLGAGGISTCAAPSVSPAYIGVGYIIGPELAALNFSGSVIAWGLLIPLLIFFLGPQLQNYLPAGSTTDESWLGLANNVWRQRQ